MQINNDLINGCKNNNSSCQELVYKHYYGFLLAIGFRYITNSDDVKLMVNESFFKAFTKIYQYDDSIPFEVWIRRIMINNCIDFLRKNKKEKFNISLSQNDEFHFTNEQTSINYAEINIETSFLETILKNVPDTSRKVFCLFAIDGYSHKEIAELIGINEGTSKWHVNNARKLLKEQIMNQQKTRNSKLLIVN